MAAPELLNKIGQSYTGGISSLGSFSEFVETSANQQIRSMDGTAVTGKDSAIPPKPSLKSKLTFPGDLNASQTPFVSFKPVENGSIQMAIFLPTPIGLSFSDSASYNTIDLNIIGDVAVKAAEAAAGRSSAAGTLGAFVGSAIGGSMSKALHGNLAAAASILARNKLRQDGVANVIDFAKKQVLSPNTNVSFSNTGIRSFAFNMKLIAKDQAETYTARDIVRSFRHYLYPAGNDVVMSYPPLWYINFHDGHGGINEFVPKIYPSYLVGFTSTLNASSNSWHFDGSPLDVDISLQFQESKALTRNEIFNPNL